MKRGEEREERNRGLRAKSDVVNVIYLEGKDISISIGGLNGVSKDAFEFRGKSPFLFDEEVEESIDRLKNFNF